MSTTVFIAVLFAALLHASWNAMVKGSADKTVGVLAMTLGHVPFAVATLLLSPFPAKEALPFVLSGGVIHTAYGLFLASAYRHGDLGHVYPIARGVAPLIVTIVSVAALGATLNNAQLLGIGTIALGLFSLALLQPGSTLRSRGTWMALGTGTFIALYSLNDGHGARLSDDAPLAFFALVSIVNAALFAPVVIRREPGVLRKTLARPGLILLAGGGSYLAYSIVVWAFVEASIPLVTALRETSIVFAVLIGVVVMKERLSIGKVAAILLTLGGAAAIRLAR